MRSPLTRRLLVAGVLAWSACGGSTESRSPAAGPDQTARRSGTLTAAGELAIDGKVVARVGEDGAVTVLHQSEVVEAGVLVKSESTWQDIGVLDQRAVFTSRKDGRTVRVGADGTLVGMPSGMTVKVDMGGTPARNRTALFLIVASFAASKQVTTSEGKSKEDEKPAEPPPAPAPPAPPPASK